MTNFKSFIDGEIIVEITGTEDAKIFYDFLKSHFASEMSLRWAGTTKITLDNIYINGSGSNCISVMKRSPFTRGLYRGSKGAWIDEMHESGKERIFMSVSDFVSEISDTDFTIPDILAVLEESEG